MKSKSASFIGRNKNIAVIALVTVLLLLLPLVAMQFSDEVVWGPVDFVAAGTLLFGTGLTYELISRKVRGTKRRVAIGAMLLAMLLLIWAELAVGIFD
jgi:VIT1/CCC1 family predicted Fe2+/Mn2+ transporter